MSEQAELKGHIDRAREGIEKQLVEMGVKPDAATIAVRDQVKFGRAPNGSLLMKKGAWVAGLGYQRECAQHILPSIPAEQRTDFREDEEDNMWAAAEKNLAGASYTYTRAELLERKREKEIEQARGNAPSVDDKTLSMEEIIARNEASAPGVY